jgi:hypothetical protein
VLPFSCVAPVAPGTGPRLRPLRPTSGGVASGPLRVPAVGPRGLAGNQNDLSSRDERSILPRCHPHSAMPHSWPTGQALAPCGATPADRCCPVSLALCAGAYWRALEARGLVRWLTGPFAPVAAPASTSRWVSVPATGRYSSRSSPVFRCGAESTSRGASVSNAADSAVRRCRRPRGRCRRQRRAAHHSCHLLTPVAGGRVSASRRHRFGGWDPHRTGIHARWAASGPSSEAMRPEHRLVVLAPCYPH